MEDYDERMVLEVLRQVEHVRNTAAAAREVGVHESTMRRWRDPKKPIATPLRGDVLDAVKTYLGVAGMDATDFRARVNAFPPYRRPTSAAGGTGPGAAVQMKEDAKKAKGGRKRRRGGG